MIAVEKGYEELCEVLLEADADTEAVNMVSMGGHIVLVNYFHR
jgi:hypothetical protein